MRRTPAPNQRSFEFSLRRKAFRRRWGIPAQVKFLMLVLEDFAGLDRDTCWPSYETLAAAMDCSVKTVGRLIAEAQRSGLLIVLKRRDREAKATKYKIRRAEYQARAGLLDDRLEALDEDNLTGQVVRSTAEPDRTSCPVNPTVSPDKLSGQNESHRTKSTVSPDTLSAAYLLLNFEEGRRTSPNPLEEWAKVEEGLREFGIGDIRGALTAAKSAGVSPAHALELIAEAARRRGDWINPPGVLYARLRNAHPSTATSAAWPEPSAEVIRQRKAATETNRAAATLASLRADEAEAKTDRATAAATLAELEERHGATFDAMTLDESAEVIRSALAGTILLRSWQRARDRPLDSLTRRYVLQFLDRNALTKEGPTDDTYSGFNPCRTARTDSTNHNSEHDRRPVLSIVAAMD